MSIKIRTKKSSEKILNGLTPDIAIKKDVTILFDGKQFMIKIPKEISNFYNMKKGKKIRLIVKPEGKGNGVNTFEVIR